MRYCFVPKCKSGSATSKKTAGGRVSFFRPPDDRELRNKWTVNIRRADRALSDTTYVCEKHFEEKFIQRAYVHIVQGKEVRIPKGRPSLKKDAVPTIFPDYPENESSTKKNKKSSRGRSKRFRKPKEENESTVSQEEGLDEEDETDLLIPLGNSTVLSISHSISNIEEGAAEISQEQGSESLIQNEAEADMLVSVNSSGTSATPSVNAEKDICGATPAQDNHDIVSDQPQVENIPSNTRPLDANTKKEEQTSNYTQTIINRNIYHQRTASNLLPKKVYYFGLRKRKAKKTQTKLTALTLSNELAELKRMRKELMRRTNQNDELKRKLKENAKNLECFEKNVLLKKVAKMQALYNEGLANKQIEFLLDQIDNFEKTNNTQWSDSALRECMIIREISPKGYDAFQERELLKLPSKYVLSRFAKSLNNQDDSGDYGLDEPNNDNQYDSNIDNQYEFHNDNQHESNDNNLYEPTNDNQYESNGDSLMMTIL